MSRTEEFEFEILGCRIRFNPDADGNLDPKKVIGLVLNEIQEIKKAAPNRSDTEIAVLVALKFASDKMDIESEYRENINKLENSVSDALDCIEQVSSSAV